MENVHVDAQGTVRYGCTLCDCEQYASPKGLKCSCGHVPIKHSDTPSPKPQLSADRDAKHRKDDDRNSRASDDRGFKNRINDRVDDKRSDSSKSRRDDRGDNTGDRDIRRNDTKNDDRRNDSKNRRDDTDDDTDIRRNNDKRNDSKSRRDDRSDDTDDDRRNNDKRNDSKSRRDDRSDDTDDDRDIRRNNDKRNDSNNRRDYRDNRKNDIKNRKDDSDDDRGHKDNRRRKEYSDDDRDNRKMGNNRGDSKRDVSDDKRKDETDKYSSYDIQGKKRFNCTQCECDGFWWKESLPDTKCALCGHMPAAHASAPNTKPVSSPATKAVVPNRKTTNLDRNRKPREKCKCGNCEGYERLENGSDCVNCSCVVDHHPMKEYGGCKDASCNCNEYSHDVKGGPFDCECGHKIAKHEKLTPTETKAFVFDPNSAPKPSGPKKCACGKDVYVDPKTGKAFDKCGRNCPGVPSLSTSSQLCQKCKKKPVFPGSQFCSRTCMNAK